MYVERIAKLLARAEGHGDPTDRIVACDWLVHEGELAMVLPALESLRDHPEVGSQARRLLAVSRQLANWGIVGKLQRYRRGGPSQPTGVETLDFDREVGALVARKPGARSTLFVFTGVAKMLWVSLHVLHQIIEPLDCNVVYLRDFTGFGYLLGVGGFGADYAGALQGIADLAAELGAPRLHVIGSSGGGYAAMRYAYDLRADGVLAFSPATDWKEVAELNAGTPWAEASGLNAVGLDVLYGRGDAPHTTVVFGDAHPEDAIRCRRFGDLPGVALIPVPDYDRHDVLAQTIATGQFPAFVDQLLEIRRPTPAGQ